MRPIAAALLVFFLTAPLVAEIEDPFYSNDFEVCLDSMDGGQCEDVGNVSYFQFDTTDNPQGYGFRCGSELQALTGSSADTGLCAFVWHINSDPTDCQSCEHTPFCNVCPEGQGSRIYWNNIPSSVMSGGPVYMRYAARFADGYRFSCCGQKASYMLSQDEGWLVEIGVRGINADGTFCECDFAVDLATSTVGAFYIDIRPVSEWNPALPQVFHAPNEIRSDPDHQVFHNQWYILELLVIPNTFSAGAWQQDGTLRLWVDGTLYVEVEDVLMRPQRSDGGGANEYLDHSWIQFTYGGPTPGHPELTILADSLRIGTSSTSDTSICDDDEDNDGDGKVDWDGVDQIDGNGDDDLGCPTATGNSEDDCGDGVNGSTEDCDASDGITPIDVPATCAHWSPGSVYGSVSCSSCEVITENCTNPCNTELNESGWTANLIPALLITSGAEGQMIDDNPLTGPTTAQSTTFPVHADIDMDLEQSICGMVYTFGIDDVPYGLAEGDSKIEEYKIYTSPNGTDWTQRDAGVFPNVAPSADRVTFSSNVTASHLRLEALSSWKDNIHTDNKRISVHEIDIIMPSTPGPPGGGGPCFINSVSSLMNNPAPLHISITGCGDAPGTIDLGDQPNYSGAVLRSQPVASWQATGRIESTVDLGPFICSTPLWVFVTPDGASPSKGYPVTACAKAGREPSDVKVEIVVTD